MAVLRKVVLTGICLAFGVLPVRAQDRDRIWGVLHTKDGERHEGFIAWDRNEASWIDVLDGLKDVPPENYEVWLEATASKPPVRTIELLGYRISWDEEDQRFPPRLPAGIRFGHLSSLEVAGDDRVSLTLRSGQVIELGEGSADLGSALRDLEVDVPGREAVDVDWDDLDRIDFSAPPPGAAAEAHRLYGTVEDIRGNRYTGYVAWDQEEVLGSHFLDGEEGRGRGAKDRRIPFRDIASIARLSDREARVQLVTGAQVVLRGSNDVDRRNRGIEVMDPTWGTLLIPWEGFSLVRFHEPPERVGYEAFGGGHRLRGTLTTDEGEVLEGWIRWDADQEWAWELLRGERDGVSYSIELGAVASVRRGEALGGTVTLVDGRTFELDDGAEVGWDNRGTLVSADPSVEPPTRAWRLVPWGDFREVRFDHTASAAGGGR